MKTNNFFKITLAAGCILVSAVSFSQVNSDSVPHRYIGLGIRTPGLQLNDLNSNPFPTNRLVLNVDASKYFRLEAQYGLFSRKTETILTNTSTGTTTTLIPQQKSSFIGFGLMGLYPAGRARFMGGFRYSINDYSDQNIDYYPYPSNQPYITTSSGKMTLLSFVLGGEYFFIKYFSVGAEFSLSSIKDTYSPASTSYNPSPKDEITRTFLSEGTLVFRFYPF